MNDCNFTGSSSVTTLQPTMCCAAAYTSILLVFPSGQRGLRPIYIDAHLQAPLIPPGRHVRTSASGRDRSTGHSHRSQGGEDDHMGRLHCEQKLEVSCGVTSEHPYNVLEFGSGARPLPLAPWVGLHMGWSTRSDRAPRTVSIPSGTPRQPWAHCRMH